MAKRTAETPINDENGRIFQASPYRERRRWMCRRGQAFVFGVHRQWRFGECDLTTVERRLLGEWIGSSHPRVPRPVARRVVWLKRPETQQDVERELAESVSIVLDAKRGGAAVEVAGPGNALQWSIQGWLCGASTACHLLGKTANAVA